MFNKNTKKGAFLSSLVALILCCSMFVGTTFAWFTDEVKSTNNIITAGNLDVELEYYDGSAWVAVNESTNVFEEDTLWEPGHTEVVYLKVSNLGTLALKYNLAVGVASESGSVNVDGEDFLLSDYIVYGAVEADEETIYATRADARAAVDATAHLNVSFDKVDSLLETEEADYVTLVVYMPEEVGNEANYKTGEQAPVINLGINLFATQYTYEEDSFDNRYDGEAFEPVANVTSLGEKTVTLVDDTTLTLDESFSFKTTEDAVAAAASGYRYWHADFVVSADKDIAANSLALAGYYEAYAEATDTVGKWIALTSDETIPAYDDNGEKVEIRLMELMGVTGNYEELCEWIPEFLCGLTDLDGSNVGTTVTVELRLYETTIYSGAESGSANIETGEYITVGTYKHKFGSFKVSNDEELAKAIENGATDITLAAGTYHMPAVAAGKTLTINGTHDSVIEVVPGGQSEANGQLDYNLDGSNVTFNGVTIKTNSKLYAGYARLSAVYNNCVIQNTYNLSTGTSEFNGCEFNITNEYLRVGGASEATFNECIFNTDGRAILIFQDGSSVAQTVTVKDCTFNATAAAQTWNGIHVAAVSYDGSQGGTYVVNFEGTNIFNGDFNGLWQIKAGEANVTVNGLN